MMNNTPAHRHITPAHLEKKAVVYVRQSSRRQVLHNEESRKLQYGLADKARAFGWKTVDIIDDDLGLSASSGAPRRAGFERLLQFVVQGEVGIVFSREVSRLSRSDKDWCHLFEACVLVYTLIGDDDHVYDPNNMDDQLVLGIKATLSVVELKVLQLRLLAGMEQKARRGELKRLPPPGYLWDTTDRVVKHADQRVQDSLLLVFSKFRETRSIRQTFLWFHNNEVELPVNKYRGGKHVLEWKLPTRSFVQDVLKNPYYAGAYVWGRRSTQKVYQEGRVIKRLGAPCKAEDSRVLIKGHHEPYIEWEQFEENQSLMAKNNMRLVGDETVGAARGGQGLLAGLLRCGHCGRKMHVRYWGRQGTAARYVCKGDFDSGGAYCLAFGGSLVDRRLSKEILTVISPYGVGASIEAAEMLAGKQSVESKLLSQKLQQLQYEERRAFEQYNEVDPRHRLVAQELERRWNAKLQEMSTVREQLTEKEQARRILTDDEKRTVMKLGENFHLVWESDNCPPATKKNILRIVIQEVIVTLSKETNDLAFVIHWKGGSHTQFSMPKPVSSKMHKTSDDDIEIIRKMAVRYKDDEIARVLNKLGRRTGKGNRWNAFRVKSARAKHSIRVERSRCGDEGVLSLGQAARYCGISHKSIQKIVAHGILEKNQIVPWAPWEIKKSDLDSLGIQNIVKHLRATGKLILDGIESSNQLSFINNGSESKKEKV